MDGFHLAISLPQNTGTLQEKQKRKSDASSADAKPCRSEAQGLQALGQCAAGVWSWGTLSVFCETADPSLAPPPNGQVFSFWLLVESTEKVPILFFGKEPDAFGRIERKVQGARCGIVAAVS